MTRSLCSATDPVSRLRRNRSNIPIDLPPISPSICLARNHFMNRQLDYGSRCQPMKQKTEKCFTESGLDRKFAEEGECAFTVNKPKPHSDWRHSIYTDPGQPSCAQRPNVARSARSVGRQVVAAGYEWVEPIGEVHFREAIAFFRSRARQRQGPNGRRVLGCRRPHLRRSSACRN